MGKTIGFTGNQFSGQNRLHSINSYNQNQGALQLNPNSLSGHSKNNQKTTLKQLNNQFLTFKLEAPKIVTIKKWANSEIRVKTTKNRDKSWSTLRNKYNILYFNILIILTKFIPSSCLKSGLSGLNLIIL